MKRLVLRFRENEFRRDVEAYGKRTQLEKEIKEELRQYTSTKKGGEINSSPFL